MGMLDTSADYGHMSPLADLDEAEFAAMNTMLVSLFVDLSSRGSSTGYGSHQDEILRSNKKPLPY